MILKAKPVPQDNKKDVSKIEVDGVDAAKRRTNLLDGGVGVEDEQRCG